MPADPPVPRIDIEALSLDNALWRFALDFYGREGVSPACLVLQDRAGVDVDILLLAIFAAVERSAGLDADALAAADALVRDWRSDIVQVLRRLRVGLKAGPLPAPSPATDGLRSAIKAAELKSEQIELAVLSAWIDGQPDLRPGAGPEAVPVTVARHFAADAAALEAPDVAGALQTLGRAIRRAVDDRPHIPS